VWSVAFLYLVNIWTATVYSLAGGLLAAKVYSRRNHACSGDRDQIGSTGNESGEATLALVWLLSLIVVILGLVPTLNRATVPPPGGNGAGGTGGRHGDGGRGLGGGRVQVASTNDRLASDHAMPRGS
jgi:hypothetical protein